MHKKRKTIGGLQRLAAMLLALVIVLPLMPAVGESVSAYGMTTVDKVNIRPSIGTSDYIDRLPQGWVAQILETTVRGSVTWYKVETVLPTFPNSPARTGYIHGGYFRPFTAAEEASWLVSRPQIYGGSGPSVRTPTPYPGTAVTPPPSGWGTEPPSWQEPSGYVQIVLHNTNLREQPESSNIFAQIPKGKVLPYYGDPVYKGSYQWQYVYYQDKNEYGYIRSDCYTYTTQSGEATAKPLPPDAPTTPPMGYAIITQPGTNLRQEPGGGSIIARLDKGRVLPYFTEPSWAGGYQWLPVYVSELNVSGYVRSDCYAYTDAEGKPSTTPQTLPTPGSGQTYPPSMAGKIALTKVPGVNLRQSEDGASITALPLYTQLDIVSFPTGYPTNPWYRVKALGYEGYVHEDHIRVLSEGEAINWVLYKTLPQDLRPGGATQAPTATPAPSMPPAPASGYLRITLPGTNLRKTPGGLSLMKFDVDTVLPFSGAPTYHMGYYWAYVTDAASGHQGYVRSDCYVITQGDGTTPAVTPSPTPSAPGAGQGTIRLTLGGVNLRQTPGGTVIATMARGLELPYFSAPTFFSGYYWAYVYHQPTNNYGYVRSDCYEIVNALPQPSEAPGYPTATPVPSGPASGYLKLIKGGVNLRNAPAGNTIAQLDRDLELAYFSVTVASGYTWYQVDSPKGRGWVRSDVIQLIQGPGGGDTPLPTATPSPGTTGYILTIKSAINLRQTPGSSKILGRVDKNLVFALQGPVESAQGYNWYQISSGGQLGYLRGDCVRQLTSAEVADYLDGKMPGVTPPPGGGTGTAGHVITLVSSVNVRSSPSLDAATLGQTTNAGVVLPYENAVTAGGSTWYKVTFQGTTGYLLGSTARIMTEQEYQEYLKGQPTPSPVQPTPVPDPANLSSTAVTRMEKVLLRNAAGMSSRTLTTLYRQGTIVALKGEPQLADSYTWYPVRAMGVNGWIRGDMIRILTKQEEQALNQTGDPDTPPAAGYRRLEIGSTGEDVSRLQQELSRLGYLRGSYTPGTYDYQTRQAVMDYQRAVGLLVDGIAGSDTQHKLYNTVPEDPYVPGTGGTVSPTIYPMEKVDWYSGDIDRFWGRGETAILTDVTTRISFRVKRWAGGYHADVEPLTAADTAAMCQVYGVRSAQEILDKNLYQRRPVWITLKGRSFAASIYGVPHNYPKGDTIPDNNFNGQFCVHFVNSLLHTSAKVDKDHQNAINQAYNAAPTRK